MTRISMTFAAASLTLSLAPAAQAYQTELDLNQVAMATEVLNVVFAPSHASPDGTCTPGLTQEQLVVLGLIGDGNQPIEAVHTALACNEG